MNKKERELNSFQVRNIKVMTYLLEKDAVNDDVIDYLHESELDYFALLDKYKLLEEKVNIDEKTNLLKFKRDYLTNIIKTASRFYHGPKTKDYSVSFIRFDIDDFSVFNNEYGHETGDMILILVAKIIRDNSRPTDYVIRFGGEEFDVILPSTEISGAEVYLEKIMEKIREAALPYHGNELRVTVSAGLAQMVYAFSGCKAINEKEIEGCFSELQMQADNALYEAKYLGKDRYSIYSPDKVEEYKKIRKKYVMKSS
jgi:diguanylate cyclase (GGDEF)-like protein